MAALDWIKVHGQMFTDDEAREASDFAEILDNFGLEPNDISRLFGKEPLTVAKKLVLAKLVPSDEVALMLLSETDERIRKAIQKRLEEERINANGGIIC